MIISESEIASGILNDVNLNLAVQALHEVGYVTLEGVLPVHWVEELRIPFEQELLNLVGGKPPEAHGGGSPPVDPPFLDPLIIEHPLAMQIIDKAMGKEVYSYLPYGCNTAWPGSPVQWIHRDSEHLFPEVPYVLPPATLAVNIPLVDFTIENGCTEVWPGSHLIIDTDPEIIHDPYNRWPEEKAARLPSVRTEMPAGSVVVRDMRMLHRGMPNNTDVIRSMIAVVYFRKFHRMPGEIPQADLSKVWNSMSVRAREIYRYSYSPEGD
ncbi:MAG: phytanoyl-CoA dioxygenase family protein [Gemmatimonadota bacterium]|nr:phytanoyl-CoA dioxygenase family protein [Gemmatimonadota bacterium]